MTVRRGELHPPRRFYSTVTVASSSGGFGVQLDGRSPKTPGNTEIGVPSRALAELLAAEWSAQGDFIEFADMPATRLANTVLDGMPAARAATQAEVVKYAASDLLCYLAEGPASLVRRQHSVWTPVLEWARDVRGLDFTQTVGIVHIDQPTQTLAKVSQIAARTDDFTLMGLAFAASTFGSTILGLALAERFLDGCSAHEASRVEETFQEGRWGVDAEAAVRTQSLLRDARMLEHWFGALRQG